MKRSKYAVPAIFLGALLLTSPLAASKPAPPPAAAPAGKASGPPAPPASTPAAPTLTPPDDTPPPRDPQEVAESRKKAAEARKKVVARVNGAEINMYDLLGMMNRVVAAFYKGLEEPSKEVTTEIKQRALDRLIFEELAVKEAVKQGIKPKAEKVKEAIDNLKNSYGSEKGFQEYLADLAQTEQQLKARIERGQLLEGITGREVYQKTSSDPKAITRLYKEYKAAGKLKTAPIYVVEEVLVLAGKDEQETKASAERVLAELKRNNNDFEKLMLDGTFIVRRLSVTKEKNPKVFAKMQGMKIGEFSGAVQDGESYHIFKVVESKPGHELTKKESHKMLEDRLAPYFQEQRRAEWVKKLRKGAKIEILLDDLKNEIPGPEAKIEHELMQPEGKAKKEAAKPEGKGKK